MATKKTVKKDEYILIRHANRHIRKDANKDSESLYKVKVDERIPYLGIIKNGWYKVKINGKIGWLTASAGDIHTDDREILKLGGGNWHLRDSASSKGKSLAVVNETSKVYDLNETENGWHKVQFQDLTGWISERAISFYRNKKK